MKKLFSKKDLLLIKRALCYMAPYKIRFACAFLCVVSGIIFTLVQPFIWANVLTSLFEKDFNRVVLNIVYTFILFVLQMSLNFLQSYLFSHLNENIIYDLKRNMYASIFDLPVKAFDEMRVGEFISRLHGDASVVANIITNQLLNAIVDVLKVIIIGILVFSISFPLTLIILVTFPFSLLTFIKFGAKVRSNNEELAKFNDNYFSNMQQSILGIREIKGLGIGGITFSSFLTLAGKIRGKNIKVSVLNTFAQTISQGVTFISQIAVMGAGGYLIYINLLTMQYFIAFSSYSSQFSNSLMNITRLNSNIQQVLTSLERIFSLMDNLDYSKEKYGNKTIKEIKGDINFDSVFFSYNGSKKVLNGISFSVQHGKRLAIVGPSGGGKSTIFNLLLRFYEPATGSIRIDGTDIREIEEKALRSYVSIVRQDPFLFNISIRENLLLANPFATMDEIYEACKMAFIHDFILGLQNGYDSIIDENGVNLSGGQRQRIAIARALLKKSKIILFDEATSSLDNQSQHYIKKAIDKISKDHTIIIIAHRLLTVIEADDIIVIDDGRKVGQGTHSILINENKIYKQLYEAELNILKEISTADMLSNK